MLSWLGLGQGPIRTSKARSGKIRLHRYICLRGHLSGRLIKSPRQVRARDAELMY